MTTQELVDRLRALARKEPEHPPEEIEDDLGWAPPRLRYVVDGALKIRNSPLGELRFCMWLEERDQRGVTWN